MARDEGLRVSGLGFRGSGSGFRISGLGCRVSGLVRRSFNHLPFRTVGFFRVVR